jgi:formate dehydrogenase subunit delta
VQGTAAHINKFWEPRMRRQILGHLEAGGEGLVPLVREALALVPPPAASQLPDAPRDTATHPS